MRKISVSLASCWWVAALSVGLCACGGDTEEPPSSSNAGALAGTFIDTYLFEGGEESLPRDPARVSLAALVPQPDKHYSIHPGTLDAAGNIKIPDVPEGVYFLKIQPTPSGPISYYQSSVRTLELGAFYASRPDVEALVAGPAEMVFDVTGLAPWQDSDGLELYSLGAGTWGVLYFTELMAGNTSLSNAVFDAMTLLPPALIDGELGDSVYITQLTTKTSGSSVYQSIEKVLEPSPFTLVDGGQVSINGMFQDVPQNTLPVTWKRSAFANLAKEAHASAVLAGGDLYFYAETGGPARVTSSLPPTILDLPAGASETSDFSGDLMYGNPFPKTWAIIASASASYSFEVMLPGAVGPKSITGSALCATLVSGNGALSFEPAMHPVRSLQVNGQDTAAPLAGAGLMPEVSWEAPSVGTPKNYRVAVRRLDPMGFSTTVAAIYTPETHVVIPDGILKKGEFYYLRVTGLVNAADLGTRNDVGVYGCHAEALTHVIEP